MIRKGLQKITSLVLAGALLLGSTGIAGIGTLNTSYAADSADTTALSSSDTQISLSSERITNGYTRISKTYKYKEYKGEDIVCEIGDIIGDEYKTSLTDDNYDYGTRVSDLSVGDEIEVTITVPENALYVMSFDYLSYDDSILPIEFSVKVDDEFPFYEMRNLKFETVWVSDKLCDYDRYGNEIVVMPDKKITWLTKAVMDSSYNYSDALLVSLSKGTHKLTIDVSEGNFLLGNITLSAKETIKKYTGSEVAEGSELITVNAIEFYERNDSSIHAAAEYNSALYPLSSKETVLNILDGASFDTAGQTVTYSFDVEKAGYYYIAMNYMQSEKSDFPVYVDFRIDNEFPNDAFKNQAINYTTKYKNYTLTDSENNKLSVYLEEGMHTISLTISADPIRFAIEAANRIMSEINDLSLEVTKVVGSSDDSIKYSDIKLTRYIPELKENLTSWVTELYELSDMAAELIGEDDGEDVACFAYLRIAASELETLAKEPDELIYRVDELSTSQNSINTQIANFIDVINSNDVSIDRIYIYQEDAKLPRGAGFFKSIALSVGRFFYSFFAQSYSTESADEEHIQVWVNRPRQYVEIMQKMIDEGFTKETGIEVDLCIMTDANKLVLSNASGDTPDIATGINYSIPFELAIRGALVDLTKFSDYKEVFGRYSEGLLVSSVVGNGLYSLPETMNFYVMFYRSDILEKIGVSVPNTLDELIAILPNLQMRGLNVYYQTAAMLAMRNFHGTTPIIYQNDGTLYGETALDITLDSDATVKGITELTELFTLYNLPVDVPNFYQHFRNGDLPIGIADFNSYNLILNAAPEIANSWSIALVPGVEDEETGEIKRYMSGGAESTVMFSSNDEREQKAWEFMKWWSDADTQAEFGQMLQIMYGDEYIWPTANLEAFNKLPYPTSDKNIIIEQASYILEAPRLLGSYMTERELSNVFVDVVVNGETLRTRIDDAVKTITRETKRKLEEFGYIDSAGNVIKEYTVPSVEIVRQILSR